ncbi:MAG: class I SAM-dependent RNA methyltransferase [Methylacidiphilales bacterium]|nr:class I SAM-dependent RNA methyltransferase [Candidatus Methylacidiphilales bacterium]MDW8348920.1 class I SAM-dependent RNA methyltransferase [Verrucomicrobiae bacterium]
MAGNKMLERTELGDNKDLRSEIKPGHEFQVTIENLSNDGSGIARHAGFVLFVPYTIPGECAKVRVTKVHRNYAEAELLAITHPSEDRTQPVCSYFQRCGGCQYQHLRYEAQLYYKRNQVVELLERLGGIQKASEKVAATIPSPAIYGYRNKITPHFNRSKRQAADAPPALGFLKRGSRHEIVDIESCAIATDAVNAGLAELRQQFLKNWRDYRRGATLLIRESDEGVVTDSRRTVSQTVCGIRLQFPAGDFFQNNRSILNSFVEYVVQEAKGADYLVDAYCGSGLFALCGAKYFKQVFGVEISPQAVERARENARINGISHVEFRLGDAASLFRALEIDGANAAMIIDPPRRGCDEAFLAQAIAFSARRVVYVSCYPPTQIRDMRSFLENGYELVRITPFDLFPQTKHVETVMTLDRKKTE